MFITYNGKGVIMASHSVEIRRIPRLLVGNSDVVFDVKRNEEMLGSLRVSKGHLVWRPSNNQFGYWLKWSDFDTVALNNGSRRRVNF